MVPRYIKWFSLVNKNWPSKIAQAHRWAINCQQLRKKPRPEEYDDDCANTPCQDGRNSAEEGRGHRGFEFISVQETKFLPTGAR